MARIRSIHPGQWKDGDFLECSPLARLLCLALRNIADDRGVFRWKPMTLKAECLPCDNCDINELLSELVAAGQIERYECNGKAFGIIADFCDWQRPKKPSFTYPVTKDVRERYRLHDAPNDTIAEPVLHQSSTDAEEHSQREEGGGRGGDSTSSLRSEEAVGLWNDMAERCGLATVKSVTKARKAQIGARLKSHGVDGWRDVLRRIEASPFLRGENDRGWRADFDFAISERGYTKISEGKYDRPGTTGPPENVVQFRTVEDILAEKAGADEARAGTVSGT